MNKDYPKLGRSPGEPIIQGAGLPLPIFPKGIEFLPQAHIF